MATPVLVSSKFAEQYGGELSKAAERTGIELELLQLPVDPAERLVPEQSARIEIAFFSWDINPDYSRSFFAAAQAAENLRWLHTMSAGVDHPIFQRMLERGVRLTTSAGSTAEPIAQTLIGGVLMLARNFPFWLENQRKREWNPMGGEGIPEDLRGQTMVIFGLGSIGHHVARLAQALGLHVIGVRRSPARPEDPVHELVPPGQLLDVLPDADWLAISAPLTEETRGTIDREALARLPQGARVLNVGRGEIIDEAALIDALRSGRLGGAYLDVFHEEPLPPDSPLWTLPNVIVTPHNSAVSRGNEGRGAAIFLENLERWARGEPLRNEVFARAE